jgi:hypothetical protein
VSPPGEPPAGTSLPRPSGISGRRAAGTNAGSVPIAHRASSYPASQVVARVTPPDFPFWCQAA